MAMHHPRCLQGFSLGAALRSARVLWTTKGFLVLLVKHAAARRQQANGTVGMAKRSNSQGRMTRGSLFEFPHAAHHSIAGPGSCAYLQFGGLRDGSQVAVVAGPRLTRACKMTSILSGSRIMVVLARLSQHPSLTVLGEPAMARSTVDASDGHRQLHVFGFVITRPSLDHNCIIGRHTETRD